MRNIAEAMIQMNGGLIDALRRTLYQKAYEFGINRLALEDILKNLVPSTIINEKDGTQLALIYEGMFLAGGSRTNLPFDECIAPGSEVRVEMKGLKIIFSLITDCR